MVDARQLQVILDIAARNNGASQVVKNLDNDLKAVGKTTDSVSQRLADISRNARVEKIGESFGKMARKIKDTDAAAAQLQKRLEQIGATEPEIARATGAFATEASGGGKLSPFLARIGREARTTLPSVPIGGLSTDMISKLVGVFGSLPPAVLPVIAVLGAFAAVIAVVEQQSKGAKEAIDAAVNANKTYYKLIGDQTSTEEAIKRLEELKKTQESQQAELKTLQSATGGAFKEAQQQYGDLAARILFGVSTITTADDELAKRQDELKKSTQENANEIQGITRALNDGTLASNDYRKALEAEAKIKAEAALAGANDTYNRQLKLQQDSLLSSSQLFSKLTSTIQEQSAAQAALNQLQKGYTGGNADIDKQITAFQLQIARAGSDITRYYDLIAQRKPIEDAIQNEKELAAARKEVDKINADVNKAAEKYGDDLVALADKFRESMTNLKTAFGSANTEAEIDRQNKIADLALENNDKQVEAQTKYNEEREKIEENYRKRVKEIEREYTRSSAQAIQDRDAVALDAAQQKRKDELTDASENRKDNLAEREKEYRAELRQLQKSNADKIAEINREFQREYEQRQRKYAADQAALLQNAQQDRDARTAAYNKQLADLRTNLQQNSDLWAAAGQTIVNYAKSVKDSINNILGGGTSAVANGAVSGSSGNVFSGLFGGSSGGTSTASAGLGVRSPKSAAPVGVSLNVNGVGLNRNQVNREAIKVLNDFWDSYDRAGA